MDLAEKIKYVRTQEGLSRREMSELTSIAFQTLTSYESKRRAVGANELLKITHHPRFNKYALFLVTDAAPPGTEEEAKDLKASEFASALENMTTDQIEQVITYMEFLINQSKDK